MSENINDQPPAAGESPAADAAAPAKPATPDTVPYARFREINEHYNAVKKDAKAALARVAELEQQIASQSGDAAALVAAANQARDAAVGELRAAKTAAVVQGALLAAGAAPQTLAHAATLVAAGVSVDEAGAVQGVEEAVAKLKGELPALFGKAAPSGHHGGAGSTERDALEQQLQAARANGDARAISALKGRLLALEKT